MTLGWGLNRAVDTTLISPLTRGGAGHFAAAVLLDARKAKESAYPEPLHNSRCRLDVLGIEVGGRWSEEAASFITDLARTKIRDTPAPIALRRYRLFHFEMDSFLHTRGGDSICSQRPFRARKPQSHLKKKCIFPNGRCLWTLQILPLDFGFWTCTFGDWRGINTVPMPGL